MVSILVQRSGLQPYLDDGGYANVLYHDRHILFALLTTRIAFVAHGERDTAFVPAAFTALAWEQTCKNKSIIGAKNYIFAT